jgi:hypothetical protein
MAHINGLTVIHTTADTANADSDSGFELQVVTSHAQVVLPFLDLDHDERERKRTDQYDFSLEQSVDVDDDEFEVRMRILGDDGWLPSSIFVIGHRPNGKTRLLGSHPTWNKGFFDSGADPAGQATHVVSGGLI